MTEQRQGALQSLAYQRSVFPEAWFSTCDKQVRVWGKTLTCDKTRQHDGECRYR